MSKTMGKWGTSLAIRLDKECKEMQIKEGEEVDVRVNDNVIEIRKINSLCHILNGVEFKIK